MQAPLNDIVEGLLTGHSSGWREQKPSYCKILISRQSTHEDCPLYLHSRLYGVTSLTKRHSEVKTEEVPTLAPLRSSRSSR